MAQHQRRIDRVLAPEYLAGIEAGSVDDLRTMAQECAEIETEVSYLRRLAQARLDIIQAEVDRRAAGGSLGDLIVALPQILSDDGPRKPAADTRLANPLAPSMEITWNRGLERLISDATLANLPTLSDHELQTALTQLREFEDEVSTTRKSLHEVIDTLERNLAERLAVGQA